MALVIITTKKNIIFLQKNLVDKKKRRTFAHA
jgi:hypothetical protein